ncbi:hypothetical protein AKJ51_02040 [candidate division MSBL1 archaeon SCGC-AAA382A20]|uniref:Uncharacterized protein n=2 Tax=candidate division MSBL1 TaxID=215777 RepID=A0A133VKZ6_9EURY|nr:hypothetical protein AKJ50_00890 [candidate division MSBL1 archaeon SCGC-AAA382A13]KXB07080.1 hypothetical protein AKJ51_02040 [candidate division MSBL1 archaeon SCGC-AAA382A20]
MTILGSNILIYIGIFIILEAIFSIVYYFEGDPLPQVFRGIRAIFGAYLVGKGAMYSVFKTIGLFWSQVAFFAIVGLSIIAGYEVAIVMEKREHR